MWRSGQTSREHIVRLHNLKESADHSCSVESHEHVRGGGREGMDDSVRHTVADCCSLVSVQHVLNPISRAGATKT